MGTEGIDSFQTYTIQTYAFLERFAVVLATCVQLAHSIHHLALRNASTIITNTHSETVLDGHLNTVSSTHLELVDTVINSFFQQNIDAIVSLRAIAQAANIHT